MDSSGHYQKLREDIQMGLQKLDEGKGKQWDVNELKKELGRKLDSTA